MATASTSEIRMPQTAEAVHAILQYFATLATTSPNAEATTAALFAAPKRDIQWVQVNLAFTVAPQPHRVPLFFTLPHALHDLSDICLVTPPPQRKYKDILLKQPVANVKKVIDVSHLKAKFSDPVALRALANSFDVFFVHSRVTHYPKLLTGEFLTHSTPVWMSRDSTHGDLIKEISDTMRTVVCPRRGQGNVTVTLGHSRMAEGDIIDNIHSFINQLLPHLDGQWKDIHCVRIAAFNRNNSRVQLPVYAHNYVESRDLNTVESTVEVSESAPAPPPVQEEQAAAATAQQEAVSSEKEKSEPPKKKQKRR